MQLSSVYATSDLSRAYQYMFVMSGLRENGVERALFCCHMVARFQGPSKQFRILSASTRSQLRIVSAL